MSDLLHNLNAIAGQSVASGDVLFARRLLQLGQANWTPAMQAEAVRTISGTGQRDFAVRSEVRRLTPPAMVEVTDRRVMVISGWRQVFLRIAWHRNDPEATKILADAAQLPGRCLHPEESDWYRIDVPFKPEVVAFIKAWDFIADKEAARLLKGSSKWSYQVTLGPLGYALVSDRQVPLSIHFLDWCRTQGLSVDPAVEEAIVKGEAAQRRSAALAAASRCARPEDLPSDFLQLMK